MRYYKEFKQFVKDKKEMRKEEFLSCFESMKMDVLKYDQVDYCEYYFTYENLTHKELEKIEELVRLEQAEKLENFNTDCFVIITHKLMAQNIKGNYLVGYDIPFFSLLRSFTIQENFEIGLCLDVIKDNDSNFDGSLGYPLALIEVFINELKVEFEGLTCLMLDEYDHDLIMDVAFTIAVLCNSLEELKQYKNYK